MQNVTDVDDKIIGKSLEEGRSAAEVAAEYTEAFIEDMRGRRAGSRYPSEGHRGDPRNDRAHPRAHRRRPRLRCRRRRVLQRAFVPGLRRAVGPQRRWSGHRELRADGKGVEDRKRDPLDFALWKAAKPGEPAWESPWAWAVPAGTSSAGHVAQVPGLPSTSTAAAPTSCSRTTRTSARRARPACGRTFANYWMHGGMPRSTPRR